jgi:hypothetical protein
MAKRGAKAAAIRDHIQQNPSDKATDIIKALAAKRIKVTPTQVYGIMSNGKSPAKKSSKAPSKAPANGSQVESLFHVKTLVTAVGSIDQARQALDTYAKLLA